jgi:uncharacterized protein YeeX (DUF496 family)
MSKLIDKAKKSKLHSHVSDSDDKMLEKKERLTLTTKIKEYPRSYRIDAEIMNILKDTLSRVNEDSNRKITEARLVKALIFLSQDMSCKQIMSAVKEVW